MFSDRFKRPIPFSIPGSSLNETPTKLLNRLFSKSKSSPPVGEVESIHAKCQMFPVLSPEILKRIVSTTKE